MLGTELLSRLALPPLPPEANSGANLQRDEQTRLRDMAKEFEATFLSMLLKEMRQTLEPDGGFFAGDTGDVQGGLFDLFLGRHLAEVGGIGMANSLMQQLTHTLTNSNEHARSTSNKIAPTPGD
jgi:flagellar protein FlgJ